jgi:hypothetical protein
MTQPGREAVEHGQPAHDGLADDAQGQQHAETGQVAAEGHAEEGQQPAAIAASATKPVNMRLPNSIQACELSSATRRPLE